MCAWAKPQVSHLPLQQPQTNILRLSTRHFWFGEPFCFTSAARARICAYLPYIHTLSHARTSIFYHNFDAARLINLFAENIFTSFIRKNRRPPKKPPITGTHWGNALAPPASSYIFCNHQPDGHLHMKLQLTAFHLGQLFEQGGERAVFYTLIA